MVQLSELIKIEKGKKASQLLDRRTATSLRYLQIDDLRPDAKPKYIEPFGCPIATLSDVIIAWDGANAGTVSCNLNGYIGSTLAVLRPTTDKLFAPYLSRFLEGKFDYLQANSTGATIPHLSRNILEEMQIPFPELPEQQRIAEQLEQADRLRRTRRYTLELTNTFLSAAFLELFGDQNTASNPFPSAPIGEHLEAIEGGVNFNPVGENDPASDWRVLKVSAVSWSNFLPEESKPISPVERFSEKLIVKRGDLIMSRANTVELVGAVARVRAPPPKVLLPDKLWRLKFRAGSQLLPDYLLYALRSGVARHEIEIRASGTSGSMKNISKDDVRELCLPVPPHYLQQKFADIVERVEHLRAVQREALRQAEHLFLSLLNRSFRV